MVLNLKNEQNQLNLDFKVSSLVNKFEKIINLRLIEGFEELKLKN
jgi:hypothetical protein